MMKWLLEHIWWVSAIFTAILLILLAIAIWIGEFNAIVRIIIVPLTAIIAILTTLGWREHNKKKTERKTLVAVKNELEYNLQILDYNQNILDNEIELIEDNKFSDTPKRNKLILEPLLPLKTGFWDIITFDLFPDKVKKSELFVKIRDIDMCANKINEQIKSRENYKNTNIEAHDISSTVKRYDRLLLENIEGLRTALMNLGMHIYKLC
ncbi:MAG: hypothetical protein HZC47_03095 [Methanobacterium sp.]|uniref:hypothetical protein n=1 Tax=Methanobacterium sp. TaxID=2164 RepID=UPI003D648519|nr:hypothetical protein [Methanobacterium sp.]